MKRRLLWTGGSVVAVAVVITVATWFGGMALDRRFDKLTALAERQGMNLTMPERPANPEAERLRAEIDAFDEKRLPSLHGDRSFYSEDAADVYLVRKDIAPIVPKVFDLSNCESFGRSEPNALHIEAIDAAAYLLVEGNAAIIEKSVERLVEVGAAIRRIAHIVPSEEVVGAAVIVLISDIYAFMLQRGVAIADTEAELQLLFDEVSSWEIKNFKGTAANTVAEEFIRIDQQVSLPIDTKNPIEFAEELGWRTKPGIKKLKIFALHQGLDIYPRWSDDAKVLSLLRGSFLGVFDVNGAAHFLKLNELEMRRHFASLWATLHARKRQLNGVEWPTVEELDTLGIEVRDPITGDLYEWREIDGRKRLYGKYHSYGDTVEEDFLLVSDGERRRAKVVR